jgi:hypothetical protein
MSGNEKAALLPCPFCGSKPTVRTRQDESLWSHNIVTKTQISCGECDIFFETEPGYEFEAPEAWNRRALIPSAIASAGGGEEVVTGKMIIAALKAKEAEVKAERESWGFGSQDYRPLYHSEIVDALLPLLATPPAPAASAAGLVEAATPKPSIRDPFRPAVDVDADDDYYPTREDD